MTLSPKDLARALYLACRDASDKDTGRIAANLVESARQRGLASLLPAAFEALPAVAEELDAERRVTVESGRPMDEHTAEKAVAAAGIVAGPDQIVRKVNPELLGGFRITTADRVIDASIRGKVEALKREVTSELRV